MIYMTFKEYFEKNYLYEKKRNSTIKKIEDKVFKNLQKGVEND